MTQKLSLLGENEQECLDNWIVKSNLRKAVQNTPCYIQPGTDLRQGSTNRRTHQAFRINHKSIASKHSFSFSNLEIVPCEYWVRLLTNQWMEDLQQQFKKQNLSHLNNEISKKFMDDTENLQPTSKTAAVWASWRGFSTAV